MSVIRHLFFGTPQEMDSIARELAGREELAILAEYCDLRDKGLRTRVIFVLQDFVDHLQALPVADRRRIACELAELHMKSDCVPAFLSKPVADSLTGIFRNWCDERPSDPAPYRWLGLLTGEAAQFETALSIAPNDTTALIELAINKLDFVDHAMHHLGSSKLLGDVNENERDLAEAANLAARLPEGRPKFMLELVISTFANRLRAWRVYVVTDPRQPFPEWYAAHQTDFET